MKRWPSSITNPEQIKEIAALKQKVKELEQSEAERKDVCDALRESGEYFKAIIQNSSDVIIIVDKLGTITYVSPSVEHFIGYMPGELIGKKSLDLIASDDRPRAIADFGRALLTKEVPIACDFCIRHKNGTEHIFEAVCNNLLDNPIIAGFVVNVRDISLHKNKEKEVEKLKELQASKAQLSNALEIAHLGPWEYDVANDLFTFNDHFYKLFRTTVEKVGGYTMHSSEYAHRFVHPDDMDVVAKETRAAIETTDPLFNRQLEHRILYEDGTVGYITVRFFIVKDSQGRTVKTYGVNQDITEHKQTEEALRTLESLRKAVGTTMQVLVSAVEVRDPYTAGHQMRVADLARAIAAEMGLPQEEVEGIRLAGSIHDIGKLSIPAEILTKPIKLSELEFSLIKEHARRGFEMLKDVESPWPLAEVVHQHHERMDGSGYPRGLKGEEILIEARILAVSDVVESMASHRPYRPAIGINAALQEIEQNEVILYDKIVADACIRLFRQKGFQLPVPGSRL